MKLNMNIISILIGLSISFTPVSAIADVAIPNTFTSGTPAVASQVNENFQAFNTRQVASLASMAGTYTFNDVFVNTPPIFTSPTSTQFPCIELSYGTWTLTSAGTMTGTVNGTNSCFGNTSASFTGTYTVNADGSGTISVVGAQGPVVFKASKDLNTLLWHISAGPEKATDSGIAIRH